MLGGEQTPDAELMSHSTVPVGIAAEAHRYLAEGGPANLGAAARLPVRHGPADRRRLRAAGGAAGVGRRGATREPTRATLPRIGVLYYRAHEASGNSGFAHQLADAIDATGEAYGVPIFSSSLRAAPDELFTELASSTP